MHNKISHEQASVVMLDAGLRPLEDYPGGKKPWKCECLVCGNEVTPRYANVRTGQRGCKYCAGRVVDEGTIAEVLAEAGLEALEEFPGTSVPWMCRCLTCGRTVSPQYQNLRSGQGGCIYCAGRRVDPLEAEERALARGLQPLEPFPGGNNPWSLKCLTCGNKVTPTYSNIMQGHGGCVYCTKRKISKTTAVQIMEQAGLKPIAPFETAESPWLCECLTCGREVTPRLHGVQQGQGGCVYCAGNKVDPYEAVEVMRGQGLEPRVSYPGSNVPWACTCVLCGRTVAPNYFSVLKGSGCGYCAGRRVDPSEAVEVMRAAGFEPLVPYPGGKVPWKCKCLKCGREPSPTYNAIQQKASGCKYCATRGFDFVAPASVYVLTHESYLAHKVGIASSKGQRITKLESRGWSVFRTKEFRTGDKAYDVEQRVLKWLRDELKIPIFLSEAEGDGWTETVSAEVITLEEIWIAVEQAAEEL